MNEAPDTTGHFYPPWVNEAEATTTVKEEPMAVAENVLQQQQPTVLAPPLPAAKPDVTMANATTTAGPAARGVVSALPVGTTARVPKMQVGVGATFRKTAAGGVTRRRSSSKEEQAKKRRERNRVLARRTRLRKKFFFQSLQQQV